MVPPARLAAAELRAAETATGADRVLVTEGALTDADYVHAFAFHHNIGVETFERVPRSACPLGDDELISGLASGMIPLRSGEDLVWVVAPWQLTARFLVGTKSDEAILRVHEKVRANMDRIPTGIPEPLIVGRGIDDVAIVTLTLAPKSGAAGRYQDNALYHMAENLQIELAKLDNVGLTYIAGGRPDQIRENALASGAVIPPEALQRIDAILGETT